MPLKIFSYHPDISSRLRFISFAFLIVAICSFFATPFFMAGKMDIKFILFVGILSLLISYGLSKLKRWSVYLIAIAVFISIFIVKLVEISIIFSLAFFVVIFDWKKLN